MKTFWGKLIGAALTTLFVVAALAEIAGYLETSNKWPKVVAVISEIASPETFTFAYRLLFLFGAALGLWWISWRMGLVEEQAQKNEQEVRQTTAIIEERLQRLERGGKDPYVSLRPDEIIHPTTDGVLWKWDTEKGADGPFCPRHRTRLFHKNWLDHVKTGDFDEEFLDSHFWFTCHTDQENFKFPEIRTTKVKTLRAQAAARLQDK